MVPVVDLNRGCQYVDEKWHKCARLAYSAVSLGKNKTTNKRILSMRCREHEAKPPFRISFVEPGETFGLGYKR